MKLVLLILKWIFFDCMAGFTATSVPSSSQLSLREKPRNTQSLLKEQLLTIGSTMPKATADDGVNLRTVLPFEQVSFLEEVDGSSQIQPGSESEEGDVVAIQADEQAPTDACPLKELPSTSNVKKSKGFNKCFSFAS